MAPWTTGHPELYLGHLFVLGIGSKIFYFPVPNNANNLVISLLSSGGVNNADK